MPKQKNIKNISKKLLKDEIPPTSLDADIVEEDITNPVADEKDHFEDSLVSDLKIEQDRRSVRSSVLMLTVIVSLIVGLASGLAGALYLPDILGLNNKSSDPAEQKTIILNEESAVIEVVEKANPAVVSIIVNKDLPIMEEFFSSPFDDDNFFFSSPFEFEMPSDEFQQRQVGAGTGFIVTKDGMIVTSRHVVDDEDAEYTVILSDGTRYPAKVLAKDPLNDLAIVKIDAKDLKTLSFADSDSVKLGQQVIAIGNTLGELSNTVTTGVVSGISRTISTAGGLGSVQQLDQVIQTDAAINPGNSGGPLLNLAGLVIGVNTAIDQSGQLIGFAIPSNEAIKVVSDVKEHGRVLRPFLGIRYILINNDFASANELKSDYGALLIAGDTEDEPAVTLGSPAEKAGLLEGDIILEINGKKINEDSSLLKSLRMHKPGDEVVLRVLSGDEEKDVLLTLSERE